MNGKMTMFRGLENYNIEQAQCKRNFREISADCYSTAPFRCNLPAWPGASVFSNSSVTFGSSRWTAFPLMITLRAAELNCLTFGLRDYYRLIARRESPGTSTLI
jgi:hypothetical protein